MSAIRPDQPLVPSVLDRLLDSAPESSSEPQRDRVQRLAELKQSVRRDLEDLLNTRQRLRAPKALPRVGASVACYGLPDLGGTAAATGKEREALAARLARLVASADTRLTQVEVELVAAADLTRSLRFQIRAMLKADPAPEPVAFDSVLENATGTFSVSEYS